MPRSNGAKMGQTETVAYLLSGLSLAFLFFSATADLPLPHRLGLLLLPKAFFESTENQARHQNQNDHNNGPDRPHGNCRIKAGKLTRQC